MTECSVQTRLTGSNTSKHDSNEFPLRTILNDCKVMLQKYINLSAGKHFVFGFNFQMLAKQLGRCCLKKKLFTNFCLL